AVLDPHRLACSKHPGLRRFEVRGGRASASGFPADVVARQRPSDRGGSAAVLVVSISTAPALSTTLSTMNAFAFVRITLIACAPAPLIATAVAPNEMASEAATEVAVMVELSLAASS